MSDVKKCFKTISTEYAPYTNVVGKPPNLRVEGIMVEIFGYLAKRFNVCFEHLASYGEGYGMKLPNGSYAGSLSDLYSNVWIYLGAIFFVVSIAIFLYDLFCESFFPLTNDHQEPRIKSSVKNSFFVSLEILLFQSLPEKVINKRTSFIVMLWLCSAFVIGSAYKGNLMAQLIIPTLNIPFNNIEEMVRQHSVKWLMARGTIFIEAIEMAEKGSTFQKINEGKTYASTMKEVVEKVNTGKYTFLSTKVGIMGVVDLSFKKKGFCQQTKMKEDFMYHASVVLYNKKFPLTEQFNHAIEGLKEFGIFNHLLKNSMKDADKCLGQINKENTMRPLSLTDFLGVFTLLAFGLGISCLAFVMELILGNLKKKNQANERTP